MSVINLAEVAAYNKKLLERYPFLWPSRDGERIPPSEFRYMATVVDQLPRGYALAFVDQFMEAVSECLRRSGGDPEFLITGFSLGSGMMRIHCNSTVPGMSEVFDVYEYMSERTCSVCGTSAGYVGTTFENAAKSVGRLPFCGECMSNVLCEQAARGMAPSKFSKLQPPEWRRIDGDVHMAFDGKAWNPVVDPENGVDTSGGFVVD